MKFRVLSDKDIEGACKLRGVNSLDGVRVVYEVIPAAFHGRLVRYQQIRSTLGTVAGRWEVEVTQTPPLNHSRVSATGSAWSPA